MTNTPPITLEDIWDKRASGLEFPDFDLNRPVTTADVYYLISRFPFLQIMNTEGKFEEGYEPHFITAQSGWQIHDYGDALSSSLGEFLFGGGNMPFPFNPKQKDDDDGGEGGTIINPGKGTVIKQAFDTAMEMLLIAIQRGWAGIEMVDGTSVMKWAAWLIAAEHKKSCIGFEPTEEDKKRRKRLKETLPDLLKREEKRISTGLKR